MHVLDSIKGSGQVLDRAILQVIKAHVDCSKSTKFERSIMSTLPKMLDSKLAYDAHISVLCKLKGRIYTYTQNAPQSKCLGQQNCMCLIANVHL